MEELKGLNTCKSNVTDILLAVKINTICILTIVL